MKNISKNQEMRNMKTGDILLTDRGNYYLLLDIEKSKYGNNESVIIYDLATHETVLTVINNLYTMDGENILNIMPSNKIKMIYNNIELQIQTNYNVKLFNFLYKRKSETGLYLNKNNEAIAIIWLPFNELSTFTDIVGKKYFIDNGLLDIQLNNNCVCVYLNEIFKYGGHSIKNYKECFNESKFKEYEEYMD